MKLGWGRAGDWPGHVKVVSGLPERCQSAVWSRADRSGCREHEPALCTWMMDDTQTGGVHPGVRVGEKRPEV